MYFLSSLIILIAVQVNDQVTLPLEILPLSFLTEEINLSLLAKTLVTFSDGFARQYNTDAPVGPTIVASTPIKGHKEPGSQKSSQIVVHKEGHYTTKELSKLADVWKICVVMDFKHVGQWLKEPKTRSG